MTTDIKETVRELREKYGQGNVIPFTMEVLQDMALEINMLLDAAEKAEAERAGRIEAMSLMTEYAEKAGRLSCELALEKEKAERYEKALREIAVTPYRIYDGNRPFVSDHDSGYAMGVADGHRLAAKWADEALAPEPEKEIGNE